MNRTPNRIREKLSNGLCVTGTAIFSWSPNMVDVVGLSGLDFVRLDTEHAWRRDGSLEQLVRAALLGGVEAIVRVDRSDPFLIRKALEIGAGGIIVPDVTTVDEAESVVRAAKFPPRGERGYSGNCLSAGWGARAGAEWVRWSDTEPMIGIMIENVRAIEQVDDILAVDGIDFALFGPSDYSMSLGLGAPNAHDGRVQSALTKTIESAHRAKKHIALGVGTDPDKIRAYIERGVTMLELGNDLGIVRTAWGRAVEEILG